MGGSNDKVMEHLCLPPPPLLYSTAVMRLLCMSMSHKKHTYLKSFIPLKGMAYRIISGLSLLAHKVDDDDRCVA
eukprot:scaffold138_cov178-Ochromonas_danica.AAC.4